MGFRPTVMIAQEPSGLRRVALIRGQLVRLHHNRHDSDPATDQVRGYQRLHAEELAGDAYRRQVAVELTNAMGTLESLAHTAQVAGSDLADSYARLLDDTTLRRELAGFRAGAATATSADVAAVLDASAGHQVWAQLATDGARMPFPRHQLGCATDFDARHGDVVRVPVLATVDSGDPLRVLTADPTWSREDIAAALSVDRDGWERLDPLLAAIAAARC